MTTLSLRDLGFVGGLGGADPDPYFANVSLLLHGNGVNGSTTITDSSLSPKTVAAVGNAQISTAQSKFGGASIAFDGSGDELTVTIDSINIGTSSYTVESWLYLNTTFNFAFIGVNSNFYLITLGGTLFLGDALVNNIQVSSSLLPVGAWFHKALSFDGTTYRLFINGVLQGSSTTLLKNFNLGAIRIGAYLSGYALNGYMDDLRITNGVARYTANFTPPTAPFPDF
jgi:Concanavalin A-like lectin/glucanases superfamily